MAKHRGAAAIENPRITNTAGGTRRGPEHREGPIPRQRATSEPKPVADSSPKAPAPDSNPDPQGVIPKGGSSRQPGALSRIGKGSAKVVGSNPTKGDSGGIVAIFGIILLVVVLGIYRGKQVSKGAVVIAWLLLFFVCLALVKLNKAIAYSFAVLLLIEAILEFGPTAFEGFMQGSGTTSAQAEVPIQQVGNGKEDATTAILAYLGLKAGTNLLSGAEKGVGQAVGGAAAGGAAVAGKSLWSKIKGALKGGAKDVGTAAEDAAPIAEDVAGGVAEATTGGAG